MKVRVLNSETLGEINQLNLALATRIQGECIVGRSPNSGLVLESVDVSRLHGKFIFQHGNYYFCDLGSKNGSLVNGKLAQTNESYMLTPGDVVRIGDFVLIMEEISEEPEELPVTVFRGIDATAISDWRSAANIDTPEVANQAPEPVSEVPEVMAQAPEAVSEVPSAIAPTPQPVSEVPSAIAPTPQPVSEASFEVEAPEDISQVPENVQAPLAAFDVDAIAPAPEQVNEPELTIFQDLTIIQVPLEVESHEVPSELAPEPAATAKEEEGSADAAIAPTPQPVSEASGEVEAPSDISQVTDDVSEVSEETVVQDLTIIQIRETPFDFDSITPAEEEPEAAAVSEETLIQVPEAVREVPEAEEAEVFEVISDTAPESVREVPEPVTTAPEEEGLAESAIAQTLEPVSESEEIAQTSQATNSQVNYVQASEAFEEAAVSVDITYAPSAVTEATEDITYVPAAATEATEDITYVPAAATEATEDITYVPAAATEATEDITYVPAAATEATEDITYAPSAVTEATEDITQAPEEAEVSEVMAPPPEITSKAFEIISKKYIALMAHDSQKSELAQVVAQHKDFLSQCLTIATPSISETLYQQTGVAISQKTPSVPVGGYQAIASLVGSGDALAVIFLRDFLLPQSSQANDEALLRLCNINQVLVATNVRTADAIMHYIQDMVTSL